VIVEHYLARRHVTIVKIIVIHLKNTFYIKYCKTTFLNLDFCNFRA